MNLLKIDSKPFFLINSVTNGKSMYVGKARIEKIRQILDREIENPKIVWGGMTSKWISGPHSIIEYLNP
jgi:hypothetical protein